MVSKEEVQIFYLAALQAYEDSPVKLMLEGMIRAYEKVLEIENPTFK